MLQAILDSFLFDEVVASYHYLWCHLGIRFHRGAWYPTLVHWI